MRWALDGSGRFEGPCSQTGTLRMCVFVCLLVSTVILPLNGHCTMSAFGAQEGGRGQQQRERDGASVHYHGRASTAVTKRSDCGAVTTGI